MMNEFIARISSGLQQAGYLIELTPRVPGVQSLLYAHSPRSYRLGFAKVEDHFLFIDWENSAFGRLEQLLDFFQHFSDYANRNFHLPNALRMEIPNLAVVAVSQAGFPDETIRFAHSTYLNPWYGGETGQIVLVDLEKKQVHTHRSPVARQPGSLPLTHAAQIIQAACQRAF